MRIFKSGSILLGLFLICVSLKAEKQIRLSQREVNGAEGEKYLAHFFSTEKGQLKFVAPPQWKIKYFGDDKVFMNSPDERCVISLRLTPANAIPLSEPEKLRKHVTERFRDGAIFNVAQCYSGIAIGQSFDLNRIIGPFINDTRIAFIPYFDGVIEVEMTAPHKDFSQWNYPFGAVMNSFQFLRIEPRRE